MTYQLAFKRKFVNGASDFQGIGVREKESPLTVDGDQFVVGSKSFVASTRFYSDLSVGGKYYGDGSQLTNLPVQYDATKVPLAGGTMTGNLNMSDGTQIILTNSSASTTVIQPLAVDLTVDGGDQTTQLRIDYLRFTDGTVLDATICQVGPVVDSNYAGLLVQTGGNIGQPCHVLAGFEGSAGQEPKLQLRNAAAGALVEVRHDEFRVQSDLLSYRFINDTKVMKWDAGTSYRIRPDNGSKINMDDAIVVSNFNPINFLDYNLYLDSNGQGGFMVYICNPGNLPDPFITSPDIYFVGGQIGGATNGFTLPKWTSARFILTPTDPSAGYPYDFIWMVSW
jgi:hypothetical protein